MLGLKRNTVELYEYDENWLTEAQKMIELLNSILKNKAIDIQHVGSTSIKGIRAKPIIDIAVGVKKFEDIEVLYNVLEENGIIHKESADNDVQRFFSCGDFKNDIRTHHIHVIIYGEQEWNNYIIFRDELNMSLEKRKKYESLKEKLKIQYPNDRQTYTQGKSGYIKEILENCKNL